jgi:hypothetical protein
MSKNTNLSFLTDFLTADIVNSRVGMNNASPQNTFDVTGTGKFSGILTLGSTVSNGTYTYTLPSATGTLALTSDIPSVSGYVPYTGAAASVNLGVYSITANAINSAGSGSTAGQINLRSDAFFSLVNGYGSIASGTTNQFNLYQTTGAGVFRGAILSLNSITESATRTFTFPDASGTIALTSSIPANPVGGTGTTNYLPKFTGTSTIGNSIVTDNGSVVSVISGTLALSNAFNLTGRNAANTINIALIGRNSSDRVIIDADGYGTNIGGGGTVFINPTGGNVGIGTIIPQRILTIYDTNSATLYQTPTSGTTANSGFYVGQTGNVSYLYNYNNFPIVLATNSVESVRLFETSQNVHIGPTPASDNGARLQVSGQISIIDPTNNSPLNWSRTGGPIGYLYSDGDNVGITNVFDFGAGYEGILLNTSSSSINFYTNGVSTPRLTIASTGAATFSSSVNLTSIFPVLTVQGTASGIHIGSNWSVSANQDGTGRTIIATAGQGRAMYFENNGDIVIPNNSLQVGSTISAGQSLFQVSDTGVGTKTIVSTLERTGATPSGSQREVGIVFKDGNNPTIVGGITGIRYNSAGNFIGGLRFYVQNTSATPATSFSNLLTALTLDYTGAAAFSSSVTAATAINVTGNGGFFNAANKFGLDHFSGASRFYSSGANISTKGAFEFHINNSTGSLDDIALGISNTGAATFSSTVATTGIKFPAVAVPSADANTLDDYEEGTWTMGIAFGGNSVGVTYSQNVGLYTKIGNKVTVTGYLFIADKGSSTGIATITGLPFTIQNSVPAFSAISLRFSSITFANQFQGYGDWNNTIIFLSQTTEAGATTNLTNTNFINPSGIILSFTYFV